jgi:ABC-type transport system involved in multi-copper enzyme maturation permease subunit
MIRTTPIVKALLWKQTREIWPVLLITIAGYLTLFYILSLPRFSYLQYSPRHQWVHFSYILVLPLAVFANTFSREHEKNTFSILATKPLSPLFLLNAKFLVGLFLCMITYLVIYGYQWVLFQWVLYPAYPARMWPFLLLNTLLFFAMAGAVYQFCSLFSPSRIVSTVVCIVVSCIPFYFLAIGIYPDTKSGYWFWLERMIVHTTHKISFLFLHTQLFFIVWAILVGLVLGSAMIHWNMHRKSIMVWKHALVLFVLILGFNTWYHTMAGADRIQHDRVIKLAGLSLPYSHLGFRTHRIAHTEKSQRMLFFSDPDTDSYHSDQNFSSSSIHLQIFDNQYRDEAKPLLVFDEPIQNCFNISTLPGDFTGPDTGWQKPFKCIDTEDAFILTSSYRIENGTESIGSEHADLYSHFQIKDGTYAITPVEKVVFHYEDIEGEKTYTHPAAIPGVFNKYIIDKRKLINSLYVMAEEHKDNNQTLAVISSSIREIAEINDHYRGRMAGHRKYYLSSPFFWSRDRQLSILNRQIIHCIDLSNPAEIHVYAKTAFNGEISFIQHPLHYANYGHLAVDENRAVIAYNGLFYDTLVFFDASDPDFIHETHTIYYPAYHRFLGRGVFVNNFTQWKMNTYAENQVQLSLHDNTLFVSRNNTLLAFDIIDDKQLRFKGKIHASNGIVTAMEGNTFELTDNPPWGRKDRYQFTN